MIEISQHAYERAKERLGFTREALERHAARAFSAGVQHDETRGRLKRFVDALYLKERSANQTRIFAEHVFLFCNNKLITVFELPHEFRRAAAKAVGKRNGRVA